MELGRVLFGGTLSPSDWCLDSGHPGERVREITSTLHAHGEIVRDHAERACFSPRLRVGAIDSRWRFELCSRPECTKLTQVIAC